jgi:acetyl esterase/lipase
MRCRGRDETAATSASGRRPPPTANPRRARQLNLPPLTVFAGTRDILTPDALLLRDKADAVDGDLDFYIYTGMYHDWILLPGPESRDAMDRRAFRTGADLRAALHPCGGTRSTPRAELWERAHEKTGCRF